MVRVRKEGTALVYRCAKQHSEPGSDKRGAKADELHLTPPPRSAATALAAPVQALPLPAQSAPCGTGEGVGIEPDWDLAAQPAPD